MPSSVAAAPSIRALRARAVDVPLVTPHPTAGGVVTSAPLVLLDVTTDDGVVGRSYVFTYSTIALRSVQRLVTDLAPVLTGQPAAPQHVYGLLQQRFRLLGAVGLAGMAIGGIDMALWDALAVRAGVPLYHLLGGRARPLPAYASLGMMSADQGLREIHGALQDGFRAVKFKIGGAHARDDAGFVGAMRRAAGDGIDLMVDYNQSLGPSEAVRRGRALAPFDLAWIEEPCRYDDDAGHAQVAAALETPILHGENWWSPAQTERALAANALDEVMLDVMKIGGVTGWLAAAAVAAAHGRTVSSHLFTEFSAHLVAASETGRYVEWLDLVSPILEEPLVPRDGVVTLSERPGAGIAWREEAVERYAVT